MLRVTRTISRSALLSRRAPLLRTLCADAGAPRPWELPMPDEDFAVMRDILAAPSPVGMEAAMTRGVLAPYMRRFMPASWGVHEFKGNAGIVFDTHPGRDDLFTICFMGHADKIRCQVRSVSADGKVYIESDSFLPLTLLGNEVVIFSQNPARPGEYRRIEGGTVEALGAIHFASANLRSGAAGVKKEQLYVELHVHGERRRQQVEELGIKAGDPVLMHRPIRRGLSPHTFSGAYLDNGLGCFAVTQIARLLAQENWPLRNVRCLFAASAFEEIGRFGSRVLAAHLRPDAIVALDVSHDYDAAPLVGDQRFPPLKMGRGFTLSTGAVVSEALNAVIQRAAARGGVPFQRNVCGRDTGTDAMAGVLGSIDCAVSSVGFPIRNMHTVSEAAHTGDVLAAVHAMRLTVLELERMNEGRGATAADLVAAHPRLDLAPALSWEELRLSAAADTARPAEETEEAAPAAAEGGAGGDEAPAVSST